MNASDQRTVYWREQCTRALNQLAKLDRDWMAWYQVNVTPGTAKQITDQVNERVTFLTQNTPATV